MQARLWTGREAGREEGRKKKMEETGFLPMIEPGNSLHINRLFLDEK
jgi:hypothetical protein